MSSFIVFPPSFHSFVLVASRIVNSKRESNCSLWLFPLHLWRRRLLVVTRSRWMLLGTNTVHSWSGFPVIQKWGKNTTHDNSEQEQDWWVISLCSFEPVRQNQSFMNGSTALAPKWPLLFVSFFIFCVWAKSSASYINYWYEDSKQLLYNDLPRATTWLSCCNGVTPSPLWVSNTPPMKANKHYQSKH